MGRKPLGDQAMTDAERARRYRERLADSRIDLSEPTMIAENILQGLGKTKAARVWTRKLIVL